MLILRTNLPDGSSPSPEARGFKWPLEIGAHIEAPEWSPKPICGHGLHGWAWGQGSATVFCNDPDALWIVFEAPDLAVVHFDGKVKAKEATIQFAGPQKDATDFLIVHTPPDKAGPVIGACLSVGDNQMVAVGDLGKATAGSWGNASAGDYGTATAGDEGTATAGHYGTATAGYRGEIHIKWWDEKTNRFRTLVGYIGEDGLEPNTPYKVEVSKEGTPRFVKAL